VIEQAVGRKYLVGADRQQVAQSRKPPRRKRRMLGGQAIGDRFSESSSDDDTPRGEK
jgi:hypothetical protein